MCAKAWYSEWNDMFLMGFKKGNVIIRLVVLKNHIETLWKKDYGEGVENGSHG